MQGGSRLFDGQEIVRLAHVPLVRLCALGHANRSNISFPFAVTPHRFHPATKKQ
jgi:hypothetical protein